MNNLNFNELTLENMGQWPVFIKYILAAFLALMFFGLGYWVMVKPSLEQYNALIEQENKLKTEFEKKQQIAAKLSLYRAQLQMMQERFGNMLKQLPTKNEIPGLLDDLSQTGVANGLRFKLFAPQPEVAHDSYIELPINITVVGNYHQLAMFLSKTAETNRIVTLHNFQVENNKEDKQKQITQLEKKSSSDLLEMKIIAKIYRYRTI